MKRALLDRLLDDVRAARPAVVVTDLASGEQRLVHPEEGEDATSEEPLVDEARRAWLEERSGVVAGPWGEALFRVYAPPPRLVIVGGVHVAQALAPMAATAGYGVTVVDPRAAFASAERFPGVEVVVGWPQDVLPSRLDRRTGVVSLSHDPKVDDPALLAALAAPTFYVGALGSRRTHAARLERLRGEGLSDTDLERIHGPVGLDIGARTPAEIAVSILAQVVERRRRSARRGG